MKIPFTSRQPKTVVTEVTPQEAEVHRDLGAALPPQVLDPFDRTEVHAALTADARMLAADPSGHEASGEFMQDALARRRGPDGRFLPRGKM